MRVTHSVNTDFAYIYLVDHIGRGEVKHTYLCDPQEVGGMINLDFSEDGQLLGIEIGGASGLLPPALLEEAELMDTVPPPPLRTWEVVFRRKGEPDEVKSLQAGKLVPGGEFRGSGTTSGTTWVIIKDDGPSERPGHVARVICVPKEEAQ